MLLNKLENQKYILKVVNYSSIVSMPKGGTSTSIPRLVATINIVLVAGLKSCVTVNVNVTQCNI